MDSIYCIEVRRWGWGGGGGGGGPQPILCHFIFFLKILYEMNLFTKIFLAFCPAECRTVEFCEILSKTN